VKLRRSWVGWLAAVVAVMAGLVALAGCGGGSSTADANQGGSITKVELINRADVICKNTDVVQEKRLAAYEKAHPGTELAGAQGEAALKQVAFPPIATEIKEVGALGAPEKDAQQVEAILKGWSRALKAVERKPKLIMGLGEGPFTAPDKLAHAYGFKACAQVL
jgi:ABC-type glycerol-3-phosphate transport system substrate-binding protein